MAIASATMLSCAAFAPARAGTQEPTANAAQQLLPDLDQQTPSELTVARSGGTRTRPRYWIGFQSAVRNIGDGALNITGQRASTRTPTMTGQQLIDRSDGGQDVIQTPSRLRYVVSPTHRHWHLLKFDRYILRRAGTTRTVVRDQKTGFCLGDRYRVDPAVLPVPAAPARPGYTGSCGLRQPDRLTIQEGISPGYGDNYQAYLEGQSLELTGLAPGRYELVHRANADHALLESDYGNNDASLLIDLRWRSGRPTVTTVASCPDSARCAEVRAAGAARPARVSLSRRDRLVCPLVRS